MNSIRHALEQAQAQLGGTAYRLDAELLLCASLQCERSHIYAWPEQPLTPEQKNHFEHLLERRKRGEPLAYLIGQKEFWSLSLRVDSSTLIPRPETELLVEHALNLFGPRPISALDLGTGSGCIAIALAHERPQWSIIATDYNPRTLAMAKENAQRLGIGNIRFILSDWFSALVPGHRYALIVSNPPYIAQNDPHLKRNGLPFEPIQALTAGPKGLDALQAIIQNAPMYLEHAGYLLLEHGAEQGCAVRSLFLQAGFQHIETHRDHAGHERLTQGRHLASNALPMEQSPHDE